MSALTRPRNPGNTGHRYKMRQIDSVATVATGPGGSIEVTVGLACGHEHVYNETYAADKMAAWWERQVGKNQRCYECVQ